MSSFLVAILLISLIVTGLTFLLFFYLSLKRPNSEFNYTQIIQKKTYTLYFDTNGILKSTSFNTDEATLLSDLKIGQHISGFHKFKNANQYFETCKKSKKNVSVKLFEDIESGIAKRHDFIFSPLTENDKIIGVFMVLQELISKNTDRLSFNQQKELEDQRNYALRQIDEIELQKSELELAFKKSSKHHIMLQKALRKIESQKNDLEDALKTINIQKRELENANKEIRETLLETPPERLIQTTETLLAESGQRIQDSAYKAFQAGSISKDKYLAIVAERKTKRIGSRIMTSSQENSKVPHYDLFSISVKIQKEHIRGLGWKSSH